MADTIIVSSASSTNMVIGEANESSSESNQTLPSSYPGPPGKDGKDGADGADGAAGSHLEKSFATASTVWEYIHNLGYTPSVVLMLNNRSVFTSFIAYNGPDKTRVEHSISVAGIMGLS